MIRQRIVITNGNDTREIYADGDDATKSMPAFWNTKVKEFTELHPNSRATLEEALYNETDKRFPATGLEPRDQTPWEVIAELKGEYKR